MIGIGIIGCGSITKHRHAPEYAANPDVEIIGFYDPVEGRAKDLADRYGSEIFTSYEELLADDRIDAVSVCSSNSSHAAISIKALNSGKHVLCEKPMATTIADAEEMLAAAKKAGKFLMIGHSQRLVPSHVRARQLVNSGELGKILTFRTTFSHSGPENWSIDKNKNTWFFNKNHAVMGVMGDLGIHKADLIRWLIGDEITEVMAFVSTLDKKDSEGNPIGVEDNTVCMLKSRCGAIGTLTVSWTNYGQEDNSTILYCSNGVAKIFDNPKYPIEVIKKDGERIFFKTGEMQTNEQQTKSGIIDEFVNCILTDTSPEISGEEGIAAMKIVMACLESAEKQVPIKIN